MGNIINDIVDEITIKPNKTKLIIKWVASISASLIVSAFIFGQVKSSFYNRIDVLEQSTIINTNAINDIRTDLISGFDDVDNNINKLYYDGYNILNSYMEFNKRQLFLVLDYGKSDNKLLKEVLEMNTQEKSRIIKAETNIAMINKTTINADSLDVNDYLSLVASVRIGETDTIYNLSGATIEYINSIDTEIYKLGTIIKNKTYPNLFDLEYKVKK